MRPSSAAYGSGVAVETLADRIIAPAMAKSGTRLGNCASTCGRSTRGPAVCRALYDQQADLEARAGRSRPWRSVGHRRRSLPVAHLLAQLVLLDAGWEAVNLGPNTPLASLAKSLQELRRGCSGCRSRPTRHCGLHRRVPRPLSSRRTAGRGRRGGGRRLVEPIRSAVPYTTYGDGLSHLAAFARTLHPRPKPPRPRPSHLGPDGPEQIGVLRNWRSISRPISASSP